MAMYIITAAICLELKSKNIPILPSDKINDCLIAFSAKGPKTIDKTAAATGYSNFLSIYPPNPNTTINQTS